MSNLRDSNSIPRVHTGHSTSGDVASETVTNSDKVPWKNAPPVCAAGGGGGLDDGADDVSGADEVGLDGYRGVLGQLRAQTELRKHLDPKMAILDKVLDKCMHVAVAEGVSVSAVLHRILQTHITSRASPS